MPPEQTKDWDFTRLPDEGVPRLYPKNFDLRTEEAARASLASVASTGSRMEREAVRAAAAKHWPDLGVKVKTARDIYPNSNHKD